ncbi:MAG TPA: nucleotidyltransferase family protein [Dokdonella sp.]|uniref:nucleotidyltransferase family protein n=1 Tax=Dokdonella sp. TaxID=2291710 RepID=UPI002D7E9E50|nr:nucleotidyltransferase family protein [Dokdonella sp.]HET9031392.1 nucleotidyltransferase family protein [Dokdonella sp.]
MTHTPEDQAPRHGVIVLAAGSSRRLGKAKALIEVDGETLVHRAVRFALETAPFDCIVVSAEGDPRIPAAVADLACRITPCADARRGMSVSLQAGLRSLAAECEAALIVLTDQPALTSRHLCALRDAWCKQPANAAASGYAETIGVPAILPRRWFKDLIDRDNDHGARDLLRARKDEVCVIAAPSLASDIDTEADLARLEFTTSTKR